MKKFILMSIVGAFSLSSVACAPALMRDMTSELYWGDGSGFYLAYSQGHGFKWVPKVSWCSLHDDNGITCKIQPDVEAAMPGGAKVQK